MNLSSKEKMLLSVLSSVAVIAIYFQFIYMPQIEKLTTLTEKKHQIETKYKNMKSTINSLEEKQKQATSLTESINSRAKDFYPSIIQAKIILQLDGFLAGSGIKGDIGFVDTPGTSPSEGNKTEKSEDVKSQNDNELKNIESMKATINYKGDYASLKKFILLVEESKREISIDNITSTVGYNGELTGTINLQFYAIPKISNEDQEYIQWNIGGTYGKDNPFLIQKPIVNEEIQDEIVNENLDINEELNELENYNSDFIGIVKYSAPSVASVTIGKSDDLNQSTYLTSNNKTENVQVEFKKVGNKYYYKYLVGDKKYPEKDTSNGVEFTPISNKIIFDIDNENKVISDSKSKVTINILNVTDKIVEVKIKNDNKSNKRVVVTGDNKKIIVTRE